MSIGCPRPLSLLAALLLAACSEEPAASPSPSASLALVLQPMGFVSQQARVGQRVALRVVALRTAGADISSEGDLRLAPGESITWRFIGLPPVQAALSASSGETNEQGIAEVEVDVGDAADATLQVQASAASAAPVTFSIAVLPEQRRIELLVPSPLDTEIDSSVRIRVRLVRQLGAGQATAPVPDATLHVQLIGGPRANGARLETDTGGAAELVTDSAGMASFRFATGSTPQSGYTIELCGQASCPFTPSATLTVNVASRAGQGENCRSFADCQDGLVCSAGQCKPADFYCYKPTDCPPGYRCNTLNNLCEPDSSTSGCADDGDCPVGERCGAAALCIDDGGCTSSAQCPSGSSCELTTGACISDDPGAAALDVRGLWFTTYHFDTSDTLPSVVSDGVGPIVDFLALVFWSQIEIDVPILGDIIEGLIDQLVAQYVPPWVQVVVEVLRDFIHIFETLEVQGEMFLAQSPTQPVLGAYVTGEEEWTKALVYVATLCPGGPAQFAEDRSCGQLDVALNPTIDISYSNNDPTVVDVRVDPFTGEVLGQTLRLYGRSAEIATQQLVNVLLDVMIAVASEGDYYDFEQFLVDIVPCADLQQAVDDLACEVTDGDLCAIPGIEALCVAAATAAVQALTDVLGEVALSYELELDAWAKIHDQPAGGRAEVLGSPANPDDDTESALRGDSDYLLFSGELDDDSWWFGTRTRR